MPKLTTPNGATVDVPEEKAEKLARLGYTPVDAGKSARKAPAKRAPAKKAPAKKAESPTPDAKKAPADNASTSNSGK